jgi:hypothetical protein
MTQLKHRRAISLDIRNLGTLNKTVGYQKGATVGLRARRESDAFYPVVTGLQVRNMARYMPTLSLSNKPKV